MATIPIEVNSSTYTQVLDGAGFVYSSHEIQYLFAETQPSGEGMTLPPKGQMDGIATQKLCAKSSGYDKVNVFASPEV